MTLNLKCRQHTSTLTVSRACKRLAHRWVLSLVPDGAITSRCWRLRHGWVQSIGSCFHLSRLTHDILELNGRKLFMDPTGDRCSCTFYKKILLSFAAKVRCIEYSSWITASRLEMSIFFLSVFYLNKQLHVHIVFKSVIFFSLQYSVSFVFQKSSLGKRYMYASIGCWYLAKRPNNPNLL